MGLAAGINFSMRSVLITDTRYLSGNFERQVQPDELLQMFGRAGRRGLDDTGFVLFTPDQPRLSFGRPRQLKRATQVDWPSLISVMRGAAERGEQPFAAAVELSRSLFSVQRVPLGVEHSLATGPKPCGLWVDAERARFVRRPVAGNSEQRGPMGAARCQPWRRRSVQLLVRQNERWVPALSLPRNARSVSLWQPLPTGRAAHLRPRNSARDRSAERIHARIWSSRCATLARHENAHRRRASCGRAGKDDRVERRWRIPRTRSPRRDHLRPDRFLTRAAERGARTR